MLVIKTGGEVGRGSFALVVAVSGVDQGLKDAWLRSWPQDFHHKSAKTLDKAPVF